METLRTILAVVLIIWGGSLFFVRIEEQLLGLKMIAFFIGFILLIISFIK